MSTLKLALSLFFLLLFSCKKEKPTDSVTPEKLENGILVLNEGLFQLNNSSLSWIDLEKEKVNNTFFTDKTDRLLGDTGNDLKRYGNKIYIVVNVSSTIEVLNATTGAFIKQIPFQANGIAKQPRDICFANGKAFVTCYDGYVDVLDTVNLSVEKRIKVGLNPEAMAISNGKVFVSNSGGLNAPTMDSTVSVIDLTSLMELQKITVGKNPGALEIDLSGNVYVITRGDYSSLPSRMHKINPINLSVEQSFPFDASGITVFESNFLISYYDFNTSTNQLSLFNPLTESVEQVNFMDLSHIETLYGVYFSAQKQQIFVLDANGFTNTGFVRVYSKTGEHITDYKVGLNPNSILFF